MARSVQASTLLANYGKAQAKVDRARKAYDKLAPIADSLDAAEEELETAKAALTEAGISVSWTDGGDSVDL